MKLQDFQHTLKLCLEIFSKHEQSLFTAYGDKLREEAISHQLACKISYLFKDFDVDCEYSRQIDGNEKTNIRNEKVRPDIIIHKRGTNKCNLAVIEVKWERNNKDDIDKIPAYNNLGYTFGVTVRFDTNGRHELRFYDFEKEQWV